MTVAFINAGVKAQLNIIAAMAIDTLPMLADKGFTWKAYCQSVADTTHYSYESAEKIAVVVRKLLKAFTPKFAELEADRTGVTSIVQFITDALSTTTYRNTLDDIGAWCDGKPSYNDKKAAQAAIAAQNKADAMDRAATKHKPAPVDKIVTVVDEEAEEETVTAPAPVAEEDTATVTVIAPVLSVADDADVADAFSQLVAQLSVDQCAALTVKLLDYVNAVSLKVA